MRREGEHERGAQAGHLVDRFNRLNYIGHLPDLSCDAGQAVLLTAPGRGLLAPIGTHASRGVEDIEPTS